VVKQRFAFVLRLWLETATGNSEANVNWRGSLEVVEPKQLYYFNSLDHIPRILREVTGWSNQHGSGQAGEEGEMEI
jgi:hypothetical protein